MTTGEALCLAYLRGDAAALDALVDKYIEERDSGGRAAMARAQRSAPIADGLAVYRWPEFQAFCKRAGIMWDLLTLDIVIRIKEGTALSVEHTYLGTDSG